MPVVALLKFNTLVAALLQIAKLGGTATIGVGLTVIVKFCGAPVQLFAVGVTLIVAITGSVVVFVAVKIPILLPVPLTARPILGVLFVQL